MKREYTIIFDDEAKLSDHSVIEIRDTDNRIVGICNGLDAARIITVVRSSIECQKTYFQKKRLAPLEEAIKQIKLYINCNDRPEG